MSLSIQEVAGLLASQATERNPYYLLVAGETQVSFPYYGRVCFFNCEPAEVIHDEARLSGYHANLRIWSEAIPDSWIKSLRVLVKLRVGLTEAIDLHSAIVLLLQDSSRARKRLAKLGIEVNAGDGDYDGMFESYELLYALYNACLTDKVLFLLLKPIVADYIPYSSNIDYRYILSLLQIQELKAGAVVLEGGCGDGANVGLAARANPDWVFHAIDYQQHQDFTEWRAPDANVTFHVGRLEAMPMFADEMFDAVILGAVCGHITEQRIAQILVELVRVLKPDGVLVVAPQEDPTHPNYMGDPFLMCAVYRRSSDRAFDKVWP